MESRTASGNVSTYKAEPEQVERIGGVFEAPDSASATGWRTQQAFELVAIC
ncbi:MAG TPA: hypothetical protein VEB19_13480 [Gemmatimonadaceae bacterium]|nr:hypothetical protein [Gemmatimonadaceae bacterium]